MTTLCCACGWAGAAAAHPEPARSEVELSHPGRTRLAFVSPKPSCAHHRLSTGEALPCQSTAIPPTAAWLARHLNRPNCECARILIGALEVAAAVWCSWVVAIQIDQGVIGVASKRGLRATAIPDITARARGVFRLVNGVPTAFEADGQTVRAGKDGVTPMTLDEWVDAQVSEAPHLFESNAGGGAAGNGSGGVGNKTPVKNPFARATWNLTEQMRLQKTDSKLAERLRASA